MLRREGVGLARRHDMMFAEMSRRNDGKDAEYVVDEIIERILQTQTPLTTNTFKVHKHRKELKRRRKRNTFPTSTNTSTNLFHTIIVFVLFSFVMFI